MPPIWHTFAMAIAISSLLACTQSKNSTEDAAQAANPAQALRESGTADAESALPLPERLAFMTGHVEAGLALFRAGEPAMAARHLLHPVSETHAAEREGLDALGFDGGLFVRVSESLDNGVAASEIEPQLRAAEENLAMVAENAGGDASAIIDFLMQQVLDEYAIGVSDGQVTDMGEYQDAFGFTRVAIARSARLDPARAEAVRAALETLLASWPKAPVPPQFATPLETIAAQVGAVREALYDDAS